MYRFILFLTIISLSGTLKAQHQFVCGYAEVIIECGGKKIAIISNTVRNLREYENDGNTLIDWEPVLRTKIVEKARTLHPDCTVKTPQSDKDDAAGVERAKRDMVNYLQKVGNIEFEWVDIFVSR